MSNFLGTGNIKIEFTYNLTDYEIDLLGQRIQFFPTLNIQEQRVHKSVLNGATTKEHLGFYHKIKVYFHSLEADEYDEKLRFLEFIDTITVYSFQDNTDFSIEMLITKAYPYEYLNFGTATTSFYLEAESTSYLEITPYNEFRPMEMLRLEKILLPVTPPTGEMLRLEQIS